MTFCADRGRQAGEGWAMMTNHLPAQKRDVGWSVERFVMKF